MIKKVIIIKKVHVGGYQHGGSKYGHGNYGYNGGGGAVWVGGGKKKWKKYWG